MLSESGAVRYGDATPCRMTGVTLHGVVSPERPGVRVACLGGILSGTAAERM